MAQKDPVCNMMVDEKKAQHVSEVNGQKIYVLYTVKVSLTRTRANMDTEQQQYFTVAYHPSYRTWLVLEAFIILFLQTFF